MLILDAGHGGFDPGGGSNNEFKEKDLTKKITDYQKRRFEELGLPVSLTRVGDETLTPAERIQRVANLGAGPNDILISNHVNNGGSGGAEVIYSKRGTNELPQMIANNLAALGIPIRNVYTRLAGSGNDFYFILRQTSPNNAMIIEYGFADNASDTARLIYDWPELAEGVVKAVADYMQVPYSPPTTLIHIVKPGESLYEIAQQYGVDTATIRDDNNLTTDVLMPKQELVINY